MARDKWGAFRGSLLATLDTTLPLQYRPSREAILRQLGKYGSEINLAISGRAKSSGAIHPGLIATVHALAARRTKFCILDVEHFDAVVIKIEEFKISELLKNEMTRVKKHVASRMVADTLQKHVEGDSIVQVFTGMYLKAQVHSCFIEHIQDGAPARR